MPDSHSSHRGDPPPEAYRLRTTDDSPVRPLAPHDPDAGSVSLLRVTNTILEHRRLIFGLPLVLALVVLGLTLSRPRTYTASTSFTPRTSDLPKSGLGNIAAQFGVAVPGGDPSQSPDFYADLLVSRPVLQDVVGARFPSPDGKGARPLGELLEATGSTPAQRREDAMRILKSHTAIAKNTKTGVIRVAVTTSSPALSVGVAARLLELVNTFNLKARQAKAADEAKFAEQRVNELSGELRRAEDEVRYFNQRNRAFRNSPDLLLEEQRLNRAVSMRQEIYTSMSQMYEQVRLDALRTIPVITVIEPPEPPARPDSRQAALKTILTFVFGTGFMLMLMFMREMFKQGASTQTAEVERFRALRHETFKDARNPFRVVGAMFGRRRQS